MAYFLPKLYQTSISPLSVRTSMIVCPKKSSDSLVSFCLNFDLRSLSSSLKIKSKSKLYLCNQSIVTMLSRNQYLLRKYLRSIKKKEKIKIIERIKKGMQQRQLINKGNDIDFNKYLISFKCFQIHYK